MTTLTPTTFYPEHVPAALRARPQWVVWQLEDRSGQPKPTKVPYHLDGDRLRRAASNDPGTWMAFSDAVSAAQRLGLGIGFILTAEDPFICVDIDAQVPLGLQKMHAKNLGGYCEYSPSHTGLHIWLRVDDIPGTRRKVSSGYEIYQQLRFMTVTGRRTTFSAEDVEGSNEIFGRWYTRVFLTEDLQKAARRKNAPTSSRWKADPNLQDDPEGKNTEQLLAAAAQRAFADRFVRLWEGDSADSGGDRSSSDLALCNYLAILTQGRPRLMDAYFRESGRMRDKWDRRHSADGRTYGQITIDKALS